ncbi:phosphoenolpyruvate hydrolase family protein [Paenibacillus rhizoplanae]
MNRTAILERLQSELREGNHIIGVSTGTGITAKVAADSGADFILMLNSGKFRQMGRSSLAGFLPFCNSNEMVMDFASKEIVPLVRDTPVLFGLNANDPTRDMSLYIEEIKNRGFAGVNNYPTVGLIDGAFREALEEDGISYDREVEAIRLAHQQELFTVAFVFDKAQAVQMAEAGGQM